MKFAKTLSSAFFLLAISRMFGIARELVVLFAFGFSASTDLFYLSSFPLIVIQTMTLGPFTTAFSAVLNQKPRRDWEVHFRHYRGLAVRVAVLAAFLYVAGALAATAVSRDLATVCMILAPAAAALVLIGYYYAVAISLGRVAAAASLLLVLNAAFVAAIAATWAGGSAVRPVTLPVCYSLGTLCALAAMRRLARSLKGEISTTSSGALGTTPMTGLRSSLALSGVETSFFLLTQFIVLALATGLGTGWVSAVSLAQRVALSVVGLVVAPASSLIMLAVMQSRNAAAATFVRGVASTFLGLIIFSTFLVLGVPYLPYGLLSPDKSFSVQIFLTVFPAFALWMIPIGTNYVVCRTMFGMNMGALYTIATVSAYLMANIGRVSLAHFDSFVGGLAVGAGVELICVVALSFVAARRMRSLAAESGDRAS